VKARTFLLAAAILVGSASGAIAQDCEGRGDGARLFVHVNGVRAAAGEVAVTLYPDVARRFLAPHGKLLRVRAPAAAPTTSVCFNLPAAGVYAIAIYHDADGDRDFDRNAVGRPTEGFGFSNDAPARLGLPSFQSVRFTVRSGDNTIHIRTRYP
jgi:uncharacterized protein (DUF2141 family)